MISRAIHTAALTAMITSSALAAGHAPDWLRTIARVPVETYPSGTPGIELLDETVTTVNDSGEVRTLHRRAYKILTSAGRSFASATIHFDSETTITGLRGWNITPGGEEYQVSDRDAVESSAFAGQLYADNRVKIVRLPSAEPGSVCAFEYEQRDRPSVLQDIWRFQSSVPVRVARYVLLLPGGWTHEERWFNAAATAPRSSGSEIVWEVDGVAGIKEEPGMPSEHAIAARMTINFLPPQDRSNAQTHRTWNDIGRWYGRIARQQRTATAELQSKTRELTAPKTNLMEKIRVIASFAQREVRYVAIEIGTGTYQPRLAPDILANRYGDCKDKVTVLSTMLHEIGIDSYDVLVNTARGVVSSDFPSLGAINHVIAAIRVPEGSPTSGLYAIIEHPRLGKLLLFDPTNATTAFGSLPKYLQESRGLLVSGDGGELIELPAQPAESSRLTVTAKLKLGMDGTLEGDVREVRTGTAAAEYRDQVASMSDAERTKFMEQRLAQRFSSYVMRGLVIENVNDLTSDLIVRFHVTVPGYAKHAGGMLIVRPQAFGGGSVPAIDAKERLYPYELNGPSIETEDIEIGMPNGLVADEMPAPQSRSAAGVSYTSESSLAGGVLRFHSETRVQRCVVPRAAVEDLSRLFASIRTTERNSVVVKSN